MAHEFIKGIDWIGDATGATALANTYFVSKSGSDATGDGTNPETPYLTVAAAYAGSASASSVIIIGTGSYSVVSFAPTGRGFYGDGAVVFQSDLTTAWAVDMTVGGSISQLVGIAFKGYINVINSDNSGGANMFDCTVLGGFVRPKLQGNVQVHNCLFINCQVQYDKGAQSTPYAIKGNMYINTPVYYTDLGSGTWFSAQSIESDYYDVNSTLTFDAVVGAAMSPLLKNSDIRSVITIGGTVYATLALAVAANPTYFPSCINEDPLFIANPSRLETLVTPTSPLLGAGYLGVNIGSAKTGNVQNELSTEFGTTPQLNTNTLWASSELQVTAGTVGRRESTSIDLGQVFASPIVTLNALLDFLNHTPDAENAMANPNHLTFEADWAGNDGIFQGAWKKFRFGIPMQIDTNGKYSGEIGFVGAGLVDIQMRFIKVAIVPRNDYNVA